MPGTEIDPAVINGEALFPDNSGEVVDRVTVPKPGHPAVKAAVEVTTRDRAQEIVHDLIVDDTLGRGYFV